MFHDSPNLHKVSIFIIWGGGEYCNLSALLSSLGCTRGNDVYCREDGIINWYATMIGVLRQHNCWLFLCLTLQVGKFRTKEDRADAELRQLLGSDLSDAESIHGTLPWRRQRKDLGWLSIHLFRLLQIANTVFCAIFLLVYKVFIFCKPHI